MNEIKKLKKEVEGLRRGGERRHREVVNNVPGDDDEGYEGKEMILNISDGTHDLLKRIGDKWVRSSSTLSGLEIKENEDGLPGLEVDWGGKRYRISLEEVK